MEQQEKQVSIDDKTVENFLKEVMDMESSPSFESGTQKSARREQIKQLLEKHCSRAE